VTAIGRGLRVVLSPHGALSLAPDPAAPAFLADREADALEQAFARGPGAGLLHLGAALLPDALPAAFAYWRRVAHRHVARFCTAGGDRPAAPPLAADELEQLVAAAPAMVGGEYLSTEVLQELWSAIGEALRQASAGAGGAQAFLAGLNPGWHLVGRVCFHLAENKRNDSRPFAFLATYAPRIARGDRVQHQPLAAALHEYRADRARLLALLEPVQRAAQHSEFVAELVAKKAIFGPQAWTADQAWRFLQQVPLLEQSGVVVRLPDWWHAKGRRPSRVTATVEIAAPTDGLLGADALLDFEVRCALDGEPLTAAERRAIEQASSGLVLIKGRWVEVDRAQLEQALQHWQQVEAGRRGQGLSFAEGMRLLAGAPLAGDAAAALPEAARCWTEVVAGRGLRELLAQLRDPASAADAHPGAELRATLRPYQETGLRWLWLLYRLGLGACLADDMGLGKTLQVIALLLRIRQENAARGAEPRPSLIVVPASLLANWQAELRRFAPSLLVTVAHPSVMPSATIAKLTPRRLAAADVVLTSYGTLLRHSWFAAREWQLAVLDEAQAIKNPAARQTRAVKLLQSRGRLVLTGTPVENRLGDLWSLFDFACPGLLGTPQRFQAYCKQLATTGYGPLRQLVQPYILRRLKSDRRVIADLPDKTEVRTYCALGKKQAVLYQQGVAQLEKELRKDLDDNVRRGLVLAFLLRFKQICNHPAQWLGEADYPPADSGKFRRLHELAEEIASRQQKALVFTQFRQVIDPLAAFLATVFGRPGLVLHGGTAVKQRQQLVDEFARDDGPPFFVLSLKAGGTGLNLVAASHVIHFDRWWNPAVENQATDRAYRIGQHQNVLVHKFVCRGTVEERIDELIAAKVALAAGVLGGGDELPLTELSDAELIRLVSLDIDAATAE
jgi:non-specific serine/threonine protein kinase